MKTIKVKCTLTEEALGMTPSTADAWTRFLEFKKSKANAKEKKLIGQADEYDTIEKMEKAAEMTEKGMTIFPKEDGVPFFWDYQLRGFFKDSFKALLAAGDGIWSATKAKANKLSNYTASRVVDQMIFVKPRKVMIQIPEGSEMGYCERPLRAETMQGPRVALACSETVPSGSVMEFEIMILNEVFVDYVKEALDYGALRGFGQWRNSGKGTFTYEII